MKFKLTQNKIEAINSTISYLLFLPADEDNFLTQLLDELMDKFNERLRERLRKLEKENKLESSLKLNTVEQRAFYCWYYLRRHILESGKGWDYEMMVMDGIASEIHKENA